MIFVTQKFLKLLPWGLKFGLSACLVGYLIKSIGVANIGEHFAKISTSVLVFAFTLIVFQGIMAALRWRLVINAIGQHLELLSAVQITFVSLFLNQFLPASLGGDAVRIWQSKKAGLPLNKAVTSVILERFVSFLSVAILSLIMLPIVLRRHPNPLVLQGSFIVALLGIGVLGCLLFFDRLPISLHRWRTIRGISELADDTKSIISKPWQCAGVLITSVTGQFLLAAAAYLLANKMDIKVSLIDFIALMPSVVLVSSLPISVAGWGVREFAMITALGLVGVNSDQALANSIILALVASAASLPGAFVMAFTKK